MTKKLDDVVENHKEEKVRCNNEGCDVFLKPNPKYKIGDKYYCPDCYIFLTQVRHYST